MTSKRFNGSEFYRRIPWQGSRHGSSGLRRVASLLASPVDDECGDAALQSPSRRIEQVAPIDKLSVVLVAVFGAAFLGERLSGANWLGVALIAAGAVLVAYRG